MNYLFDMDGVLVDSREAWFRSMQEIGNISREEFEEKYWGRDLEENLRELGAERDHFCNCTLVRYVDLIDPVPGAAVVLAALEGKKALITNTTRDCTDHILERLELKKYFDTIITSDEVKKGKPDPDLLYRAMEQLGAAAEDTVVIGDSQHDIQAGRAAGCLTVGIGIEGDLKAERLKDLPSMVSQIEDRLANR